MNAYTTVYTKFAAKVESILVAFSVPYHLKAMMTNSKIRKII